MSRPRRASPRRCPRTKQQGAPLPRGSLFILFRRNAPFLYTTTFYYFYQTKPLESHTVVEHYLLPEY